MHYLQEELVPVPEGRVVVDQRHLTEGELCVDSLGRMRRGLYFLARRKLCAKTHQSLSCSCRIRGEWIIATSKRKLKDASCSDELQGRKMEGPPCICDISNMQKWLAANWFEYLEKLWSGVNEKIGVSAGVHSDFKRPVHRPLAKLLKTGLSVQKKKKHI